MGKIKTNLLYNVTYQILILIVPLITTPYVSRVLLPEGVGTYSITTAIAKYFWMFALLGMQNFGNRNIAKTCGDKKKLSETFSNLICFQAITSMISLTIYIIFLITTGYENYGIVAICQLPYILAAIFEISWFFYGIEEFKFMVARNAIIKVLTAALIFLFVKTQDDVWIYVLINAMSILVGQLCLWPFLKKHIVLKKPNLQIVKTYLKPNLILFVSVVAVSMYTLMDKIMLEILSSTTEVGYYENAEKIMNIFINIVGAIGMVMLPRVSYLVEKENKKQISLYLEKSMKYIMILSLGMSFGLAGIGKEFSIVFFGSQFEKCGNLLMTISIAIIFYSWENILRTQYLLPNNKDNIFVKGTIYAAIINIIVNAILIKRWGALGATIGTVAAQMTAAIYQSCKVCKELPIIKYVRRLIPFILMAIIMFVFCRIIGVTLGTSIRTLAVQIIIGGLIYVLFSYIYLWSQKDELVLKFNNTVRAYTNRRKNQDL